MYVTPEQVAANSKLGVETMLSLANANFAAYEKLAALHFNATKSAFEDSMNHAKALLSAKDVQEYVNINVAAAQPSLEKAIAYSRSMYELATQQQAEFTRFFEGQAGEINKNLVSALDKFAKNAPAGSDVAVAAVKSALAAANSAYDSFAKVAKQLADNEAKAIARMLRVSPQKLNLVAQLIRGKKVDTALADLEFSRKRIAKDVRKCVMSAVANAENNYELDADDLIDLVRTAREADVAAILKQQRDGRFKVSLRSRGGHDVAAAAARFGGGGHRLAAGFTSTGKNANISIPIHVTLDAASDPNVGAYSDAVVLTYTAL